MPFYSAKPDGETDRPSTGGSVTMRVEPSKVLVLRTRLEAVRDNVQAFLKAEGDHLRARPLAQDEVSVDAARIFAENADTALAVTKEFVKQLDQSIAQLTEIARTYGVVEDLNTTAMQQNRGV